MSFGFLGKAANDFSEELIEQALTKVSQKLLDQLVTCLQDLHLPDHEGQFHVLFSTLTYQTHDVQFGSLTHPTSVIDIDGSKLSWTISNIGVKGSGKWKYDYLCCLGGDGGFELTSTGIAVTAAISVSHEGGKLWLKSVECKCTLGETEFDFDGGMLLCCAHCVYETLAKPKMYQSLLDRLKKSLEERVEETLPFLHQIEEHYHLPFNFSL